MKETDRLFSVKIKFSCKMENLQRTKIMVSKRTLVLKQNK